MCFHMVFAMLMGCLCFSTRFCFGLHGGWLFQADRAISTGWLHALLRFHARPIDVVVFHGSQGRPTSKWASRLDGTGYPVRT